MNLKPTSQFKFKFQNFWVPRTTFGTQKLFYVHLCRIWMPRSLLQFKIMGGRVFLIALKLPGGIGYHLFLLHQDTPKTILGRIIVYHESFFRHGQVENWSQCQLVLQWLEILIALINPNKLGFLVSKAHKQSGNFWKPYHKLPIAPTSLMKLWTSVTFVG